MRRHERFDDSTSTFVSIPSIWVEHHPKLTIGGLHEHSPIDDGETQLQTVASTTLRFLALFVRSTPFLVRPARADVRSRANQ